MSVTLKPYTEYKDSGVPWLGKIPKHWSANRLKRVCRLGYGDSLPSEARLSGDVPVYGSNGRVGYHNAPNTLGPCIIIGRKGSFGKVNYSSQPAFAIDTTFLVDARLTKESLRWLYYVLSWVRLDDASRDSAIPGLDRGEAYERIIPTAPREEQHQIAAFLDSHDHLINRLIRTKRRLIELLNEQKQGIIYNAVTGKGEVRRLKGENGEITSHFTPRLSHFMKPSGIDWLGDVPEHWEVAPLHRFATKRCDGPFGSGLKSMHYTPQGIRVIRLQNIGHSEFRDRDAAYISPEHYASLGDHDVVRGDLLIAGLGDERIPAGRACIAPNDIEPAMVKADCFRFRLNMSRAEPQFVAFQLSATAVHASAILSTGATRQRINLQTTAGRAIAIPPLHEQKEIVAHVTSRLRSLEKAVVQANREIDLLREYRICLIADVVTGKLDVRNVKFEGGREKEEEDATWFEDETVEELDEGAEERGDDE